MARTSRPGAPTTGAPTRGDDQFSGPYAGVNNPYTGLYIPDPRGYVMGTDSPQYQYDVSQYEHFLNSSMWDAQLAIMADDRAYAEEMYNKYNSPQAQVRQMREAGLNPDLMGVSSQGMSAPQSSMPNTGGLSQRQSINYAQTALSLIPTAISLYTGMQSHLASMTSQNLDNEIKKMALDLKAVEADGTMQSIALSDAVNALSVDDIDPTTGLFPLSVLQGKKSLDTRYKQLEGNKRLRQSYSTALTRLLNGTQDELKSYVYGNAHSSAIARKNYLNTISQYGYDVPDEEAVIILKEVSKQSFELSKKNIENQSAEQDMKFGIQLAKKGMDMIDEHPLAGGVLYFLGVLMQSNMSYSRSTNPQGGVSTSIGF